MPSKGSATEISVVLVEGKKMGAGWVWVRTKQGGLLVTCDHILGAASSARVTFAAGWHCKPVEARVVWREKVLDLGLLFVPCDVCPPALKAFKGGVQQLQQVVAWGHPALESSWTAHPGEVTKADRSDHLIQVNCDIVSGFSGGPVVHKNGSVIGTACKAFASASSIGLAIPISRLPDSHVDDIFTHATQVCKARPQRNRRPPIRYRTCGLSVASAASGANSAEAIPAGAASQIHYDEQNFANIEGLIEVSDTELSPKGKRKIEEASPWANADGVKKARCVKVEEGAVKAVPVNESSAERELMSMGFSRRSSRSALEVSDQTLTLREDSTLASGAYSLATSLTEIQCVSPEAQDRVRFSQLYKRSALGASGGEIWAAVMLLGMLLLLLMLFALISRPCWLRRLLFRWARWRCFFRAMLARL